MQKKYVLHWNEFQENTAKCIVSLRNENEFYDVTLVGEDQKKYPAHRLVLSSCSQYFKNLLKGSQSQQILLCLENMKSNDIENMLDYIYDGEVKLLEKDLQNFLKIAERFKLEGMEDSEVNVNEKFEEFDNQEESTEVEHFGVPAENTNVHVKEEKSKNVRKIKLNSKEVDPDTLKEKFKELVSTVRNEYGMYCCLVCGYSAKQKHHVKEHCECHMEGLSYTCPICEKDFRLSSTLRRHIIKNHKRIV